MTVVPFNDPSSLQNFRLPAPLRENWQAGLGASPGSSAQRFSSRGVESAVAALLLCISPPAFLRKQETEVSCEGG